MIQRRACFLVNLYFIKGLSSRILRCLGCDIPKTVQRGSGVRLPHGGLGVVLHPSTIIGDNVSIYQQVTVGRSDIWNCLPSENFKGVEIKDGAILCAGAKIVTATSLVVGSGTIVGANSVLTHSTGDNEIWAGIPAVKIK
jgi:serine O-acetyltransferase